MFGKNNMTADQFYKKARKNWKQIWLKTITVTPRCWLQSVGAKSEVRRSKQ